MIATAGVVAAALRVISLLAQTSYLLHMLAAIDGGALALLQQLVTSRHQTIACVAGEPNASAISHDREVKHRQHHNVQTTDRARIGASTSG